MAPSCSTASDPRSSAAGSGRRLVRRSIADGLAALTRRAGSAGAGGLVVVGSYVGLTTRQLERLVASRELSVVVLEVADLLAAEDPSQLVAAAAAEAADQLEHGDVVLSTSRQLRTAADGDASRRSVAACRMRSWRSSVP